MILGKIVAGLVGPENPIGLMGWWGCDWNGPESIVHPTTCNDDIVVFDDLDIVLGEESNAIIVTELGQGDEGTSLELIKHKCRLGSGREMR